MIKIEKILIIIFLTITIAGCNIKDNKIENSEVTLKGSIKTRELIKDGKYHSISILNLEDPITIDGTTINALLVNSLTNIDDNPNITLTGILKENTDSFINIKYALSVSDIA